MSSRIETRPREAAEPLVVEFDDNKLLAALVGEYDQNLSRIEQSLGVSLSCRGNRIGISGAVPATRIARAALTALYGRLQRGLEVDAGEVDAAVRLAAAAAEEGAAPADAEALALRTPRRHITPRSVGQQAYIRALREDQMVFGLGPAGTGKTYLAVARAVEMLISGQVDRIILSRPAVEAGERLGFLPGDLREKIDPYLAPLYDALYDMLPAEQVVNRLNSGEIEVAPLAFMRGRTLSHAFVILDEAQNATRMQMKMYLTRMGEGSHMVVTGDPSQVDLPPGAVSGLAHAVRTLEGVEGLRIVRFDEGDVIRHPLVTRIVRAYDADESARRARQGGGEAPGDEAP